MKFRQKIVSVTAMTALVLGITIGVAPSAHAAPGCFSGRVCIWDGANYSNGTTSRIVPPMNFCLTYDASWINRATSVYNNSNHMMRWYDGDTCQGAYLFTTYPGDQIPQLSPTATDRANSFFVVL